MWNITCNGIPNIPVAMVVTAVDSSIYRGVELYSSETITAVRQWLAEYTQKVNGR